MTRKSPSELLEEHKERHNYAQYNRLIKREWFPILDAEIVRLKAEEKVTQASCKTAQLEMKE